MKFGILKDIKNGEFRVIATPTEVGTLAAEGNEVYVCSGAGYKAGFDDEEYAPSKTVSVYSARIEELTGLTEEHIEEAAANSVIHDSGGEADIVK